MSDKTEDWDRDNVESFLRERTEPGLEAAFKVMTEDLPSYVRNLGMLRTAAASLADDAGECSCGRPDCMAAPQHKALYQERLDAAIEQLNEAVEEALQAVIDMVWKVEACGCEACKLAERRLHAPFN